jgi:aryl carrier-like protein
LVAFSEGGNEVFKEYFFREKSACSPLQIRENNIGIGNDTSKMMDLTDEFERKHIDNHDS